MKTAMLSLVLAACGASSIPAPECAPGPAGRSYPLTSSFDGSRGLELFAARVDVGVLVTGSLRNAPGNDPLNRSQVRAFVNACDGRVLGAVTGFELGAGEQPGAWVPIAAALDLSLFPDAATLDLFVLPLYARGRHELEVSDLQVNP